jgi:hypothetical protein
MPVSDRPIGGPVAVMEVGTDSSTFPVNPASAAAVRRPVERVLVARRGHDVGMTSRDVKRIPREEVWISISV